jgi:hypothetical protein
MHTLYIVRRISRPNVREEDKDNIYPECIIRRTLQPNVRMC